MASEQLIQHERRVIDPSSFVLEERNGHREGARRLGRLHHNLSAGIGLGGVFVILTLLLLAPRITAYSPYTNNYDAVLKPPGPAHIFGTDQLGRDVFSRVLWGGRASLAMAVLGTIIGLIGGCTLGMLAAYRGGKADFLLSGVVDLWLAFPPVLLLLSTVTILGSGLKTVILALGIATVPACSRIVRSAVLSIKGREYIQAAVAIGASDWRIVIRHIWPNVLPTLIVFAALRISTFLLIAAGISFLGFGAQPPQAEWGSMLNEGRVYMHQAWWLLAFPGLAIFITSFLVNLLSDGLRQAFGLRSHSAWQQ